MIENLEQYFEKDYQFYLDRIKYDRIESGDAEGEVTLNCSDSISVMVNGSEGVTLIVTRTMHFDPEILFGLEVSFGAELRFVQEKKSEVEWNNIDLASEFKKMENLFCKILWEECLCLSVKLLLLLVKCL